MKSIMSLFVLLMFFCSCQNGADQSKEESNTSATNDNTKGLKEKIDTLDLMYMQYACDCPQWVILEEYKRITAHDPDDQQEINKFSFYIEPAEPDLKLPEEVFYARNIIRLIGREYDSLGCPENPEFMSPNPPRGRVFRYYSYEVVKQNSTEL